MPFQNYKIMKVILFRKIYEDSNLFSIKLMHATLNAKLYFKQQRKKCGILHLKLSNSFCALCKFWIHYQIYSFKINSKNCQVIISGREKQSENTVVYNLNNTSFSNKVSIVNCRLRGKWLYSVIDFLSHGAFMMRRGIYIKCKWKMNVCVIIQSSILRCFVYDSLCARACAHALLCLWMRVSEGVVLIASIISLINLSGSNCTNILLTFQLF